VKPFGFQEPPTIVDWCWLNKTFQRVYTFLSLQNISKSACHSMKYCLVDIGIPIYGVVTSIYIRDSTYMKYCLVYSYYPIYGGFPNKWFLSSPISWVLPVRPVLSERQAADPKPGRHLPSITWRWINGSATETKHVQTMANYTNGEFIWVSYCINYCKIITQILVILLWPDQSSTFSDK
jgi:hypothetical protein